MNEEIFRFSVVRNPQPMSSDKWQRSVITLITGDNADYPFYQNLREARLSGAGRENLLSMAAEFMSDERFFNGLDSLQGPYRALINWFNFNSGSTVNGLLEKAVNLFNVQSIEQIRTEDSFNQDKITVSDSLIVASVIQPKTKGLRTQLMEVRRWIFLFEYIATHQEDIIDNKLINQLLNAIILLPKDIFPIPDNNDKKLDANEEAYEEQLEKYSNCKKKNKELREKFESYQKAIEEISTSYSKYLKKPIVNSGSGFTPISSGPSGIPPNISLLPREEFSNLSNITRDLLEEALNPEDEEVDVAETVMSWEDRLTELFEEFVRNQNDRAKEVDCKELEPTPPKKGDWFIPETRGEVTEVGTQDLLIVRQNLLKYAPGEIAHIENVLKGESKNKSHRQLNRTEETIYQESEREEQTLQELQTTERFELQKEASRTINEDTSKEAGVKVTASYGRVNVEAHGNYSNNKSTDLSKSSALTFAKDVLNRSVQNIRERVLKSRSRTEITEVEIINEHGFSNVGGEGNVAGIYRWVDKYYEAQIVNYGKRAMLEFIIPEPAVFFRFAMTNKPEKEGANLEKPEEPGIYMFGKFQKLRASDLSVHNYRYLVSKFGVSDVEPPPRRYMDIYWSNKISSSADGGIATFGNEETDITPPAGYELLFAKYKLITGLAHKGSTGGHDDVKISVLIGGHKIEFIKVEDHDFDYAGAYEFEKEGSLTNFKYLHKVEKLPVSISGFSSLSITLNIGIGLRYQRTREAYEQWQMDTYNAIMDAYNLLKDEYEEAVQVQAFEPEVSIEGNNPQINREIEKTELKKHAITLMTGQQYEAFQAIEQSHIGGLGYPQINLKQSALEGRYVRFFEQAMEWRHMTYIFYPYFWGRKENWVETLNIKDPDPVFEKFLRAGSARVWVPIRPKFEAIIANYLQNGGAPWDELHPPLNEEDEDNPWVALIEEIKEQLDNDFENRTGTIEVTKGSPIVKGIDTDFKDDDKDREILVNLESYRIAEVISSTEIRLRDPYTGESGKDIGVALGARYVGEPWVVKVPTNLVWLQGDGVNFENLINTT